MPAHPAWKVPPRDSLAPPPVTSVLPGPLASWLPPPRALLVWPAPTPSCQDRQVAVRAALARSAVVSVIRTALLVQVATRKTFPVSSLAIFANPEPFLPPHHPPAQTAP